jgi:hypothetical protein
VQPQAFQTILKNLKLKGRKQKPSVDEDSEPLLPLVAPTARSAGRRQAKNHMLFTQSVTQVIIDHSQLQELKASLKENLYVKPIPRPHPPLFSIHELKSMKHEEDQSGSYSRMDRSYLTE